MDAHSLYQMYLALVVIGVGGVIYFLPAVIASAATEPIRVQPRNGSTSRATGGHDKYWKTCWHSGQTRGVFDLFLLSFIAWAVAGTIQPVGEPQPIAPTATSR